MELLQRNFRWRGMEADVKRFVASCDSCQLNKIDPAGRKGLLQPLQVGDMPWSSLSFDFITCLPPTNEGNNALLVVDRLTKMVRLIPCDFHCTDEDIAQLLYTHVFSIFGVPDTLISDRDPRFTAASFKNLALSLGIKQCLSSAFHPQSDGQTERMNRVKGICCGILLIAGGLTGTFLFPLRNWQLTMRTTLASKEHLSSRILGGTLKCQVL